MLDAVASFNQDIGDWSTSLVTDMSYMFAFTSSAFSFSSEVHLCQHWAGCIAAEIQPKQTQTTLST
jgi:Mycoplasma protein of unknown function, DUF285